MSGVGIDKSKVTCSLCTVWCETYFFRGQGFEDRAVDLDAFRAL